MRIWVRLFDLKTGHFLKFIFEPHYEFLAVSKVLYIWKQCIYLIHNDNLPSFEKVPLTISMTLFKYHVFRHLSVTVIYAPWILLDSIIWVFMGRRPLPLDRLTFEKNTSYWKVIMIYFHLVASCSLAVPLWIARSRSVSHLEILTVLYKSCSHLTRPKVWHLSFF